MIKSKSFGLFCVLMFLFCAAAQAQLPNGSLSGVNAAFLQLFGNNTAFMAKVDALVLDKSQKEWARMPLNLSRLGDNVRLDIDMEQVKSRDLPEFALNSLKQVGMTKVVSLIRLDKKATYVIYPGAQSYLAMPLDNADAPAASTGYKVQKTGLGNETAQGHSCVKSKVVIQGSGPAPALEAMTWNAKDLKDFPVKIETHDKDNTLILGFTNVQFAKPEAKQFDLPAGYTEYKDPQEMMMGLMRKIAGGTGK